MRTIFSLLPPDFPGVVFAVLHTAPDRESLLASALAPHVRLPVLEAEPEQRWATGHIYVAPSGRHLVLDLDRAFTTLGPRENRARPSIDVLFRSAAVHHRTRVVAALLTGYLRDGVSGLSAVGRCGGVTIVQDPDDAMAADLPRAALRELSVDYVLPLEKIAAQIQAESEQTATAPPAVPADVLEDHETPSRDTPDLDRMSKLGDSTGYSCPECGGPVWRQERTNLERYVCHVGHAYSPQAFLAAQGDQIEESLWSTVRFLQERVDVLRKMASDARARGYKSSAGDHDAKAASLQEHAVVLRNLIMSGAIHAKPAGEAGGADG